MEISAFNIVAEITVSSNKRQLDEHKAFLKTFKDLVETVSTEVVDLFGKLDGIYVTLKDGTKKDGWGILLTVSDYLFWKKAIIDDGVRFTRGVPAVQSYLMRHLAKKAEGATKLEPADRKKLLKAVEDALVS